MKREIKVKNKFISPIKGEEKIIGTVFIYRVKYSIISVDRIMNKDKTRLGGQIIYPKRVVYVDRDLDKSELKRVLFHEIIHGVFHHSWDHTRSKKHKALLEKCKNNEKLIESITYGLLSTTLPK